MCFQTESQNKAAEELFKLTQKIKDSNYHDFVTKIQVDNSNVYNTDLL